MSFKMQKKNLSKLNCKEVIAACYKFGAVFKLKIMWTTTFVVLLLPKFAQFFKLNFKLKFPFYFKTKMVRYSHLKTLKKKKKTFLVTKKK